MILLLTNSIKFNIFGFIKKKTPLKPVQRRLYNKLLPTIEICLSLK